MDFHGDCEELIIVRPHDKEKEDDWDVWSEMDEADRAAASIIVRPHDNENEDDGDV